MAWYVNHYHCDDCGTSWEDEWSCCCDDECPNCGSGDWSPHESDDLTDVLEEQDGWFVVKHSPDQADDRPRYEEIARFAHARHAQAFLAMSPFL